MKLGAIVMIKYDLSPYYLTPSKIPKQGYKLKY